MPPMRIVLKTRQRWISITLWSSFLLAISTYYSIRRAGLSTTYSRCYYLCQHGEFRQLLMPGASPANQFLPPHLRLDRLSYLDNPETELAVPPEIDVSVSLSQQIRQTEGLIPTDERSDVRTSIGPMTVHTVVITPTAHERYIQRRLGPTDADREKLQKDEARAAKSQA